MKKIIKKILILTLAVIMAVTAVPFTGIDFYTITADAAGEKATYVSGDYEYTVINTDKVEITSYYGKDTEVTIPSEIDGMPVTSIGEYSFTGGDRPTKTDWAVHPNAYYNKKIQKVVIPSSVKKICAEAFSFNDSLSEVVLNEGLEIIDEFAFADCPKLTEISLPESFSDFDLTSIENTGIEELTFGSNLTYLELDDFLGSNLKRIICNAENIVVGKIDIDRSPLEEIIFNGNAVFEDIDSVTCDTLRRVTIKKGADYETVIDMNYIGFYPFFNSDGSVLFVFQDEDFVLPEGYEKDGFRFYVNENNEAVITRYVGSESNVIVPETLNGFKVTALGKLSFSKDYHDTADENTTHPHNQIISIMLPETLTEIGRSAFAGNNSLETINIPSMLSEIPDECFWHCSSLENIEIPQNIKKIGDSAFESCVSLKSIFIHENIKEISDEAFRGCTSLATVEMPGVEKIGQRAFKNCTKLKELNFSEDLTYIGSNAFGYCKIESVDLSNVTYIGESAFSHCYSLKSVVLNDNLERLESSVFSHCSLLEYIELPSNLISIGSSCFASSGLKEVKFNNNLKIIQGFAFALCFDLENVVLPESVEEIRNRAFYRCSSIESINIPENTKVLGYHAFARCEELTTVYFNAENCKVSDSTCEEDYVPEDWATASPFYPSKITNIIFGENIKSISSNSETYGTFENCETLETVTIPDSVEEIGTAAFKNCSNLETAVIPDSVTEIADDAFDGCDNLIFYCSDTSYACTYAMARGIAVSTFIIEAIPNQTYTGNGIEPVLSVSLSDGKLSENKDYTVAYSNNVNVGEAKVRITGLGDYRNFASVASFTIVTRSITSARISDISAQNYTGSAVTPDVTVTYNGKLLKEGTDYKLHYRNNKNIGEATIQVEGIGNFSGSDSVKFSIEKLTASEILMNRLRDFFNTLFARFTAFIL